MRTPDISHPTVQLGDGILVDAARPVGAKRNRLVAADASRFGFLFSRALLVSSLRDPFRRPITRVSAALAGGVALLVYVVWASPAVAAAAALGAAAGVLLLFFVVIAVGERAESVRADRAWLYRSQLGEATARVTPTRDGGWRLEAVSGWPLGAGTGSVLLDHICKLADTQDPPRRITLTADSTSLVDWYATRGFTVDRTTLLLQPVMSRPDQAQGVRSEGRE